MRKSIFALSLGLASLWAWSPAEAQGLMREGTQIEISQEEVSDLAIWLDNAKTELGYLADSLRYLSLEEKRSTIVRAFSQIDKASGTKANELLTRYTLRRALVIDEIVGPHPQAAALESLVGVLQKSIHLARDFYVDDLAYLEAIQKQKQIKPQKHMALFGYEYANMLLAWSKTFVDPTLEYKVTRTALGWLGNDLNSSRNIDRILFAQEIDRSRRLLDQYPAEVTGKAVLKIRRLKWEIRERVISNVVSKLNDIQPQVSRGENSIEKLLENLKIGTRVAIFDHKTSEVDLTSIAKIIENEFYYSTYIDGSYGRRSERSVPANVAHYYFFRIASDLCTKIVCVGQEVYDTETSQRVKIYGISQDQSVLIQLTNGSFRFRRAGYGSSIYIPGT